MRLIAKFTALAILAASAAAASAADLEFHGYSRVGLGFSSRGGNQISFGLNTSGGQKARLGNEADFVLEPSFEMKFTKLDDKSEWGVFMMPATYRRFNNSGGRTQVSVPATNPGDPTTAYIETNSNNNAESGLNVSFKQYFFFGNNVPQLGGGSIFVGRRYFDRAYLGALNDQFLEAQDGIGAGIDDIPVGPAKLSFGLSANPFTDGTAEQVTDRDASFGVHVTSIPTFNKDSNLQLWARVYTPVQKEGVAKRKTGYSGSFLHVAGFGNAGNLTLAARYDKNAYTDQQNTGAGGWEQLRGVLVYGVMLPSARTSVDVLAEYAKRKAVPSTSAALTAANLHDIDWMQFGFRTDTQLAGPFRFLLEVSYDTSKDKKQDNKQHNLLKVTPCLALNAGGDSWSNPTFRLFYTYASWNKDGRADIADNWKSSGFQELFGDKTSGGVFGIQAQAGW